MVAQNNFASHTTAITSTTAKMANLWLRKSNFATYTTVIISAAAKLAHFTLRKITLLRKVYFAPLNKIYTNENSHDSLFPFLSIDL